MRLQINDWVFDIDMAETMAYSAAEAADHCTCAYCRNFYSGMDVAFPRLRPFLSQFGIDAEAPDELMPFSATNMLALYAVSGKILHYGTNPIMDCGICVEPEPWENTMVNTDCPEPLFVLSVGPFDIPWVLDEPLIEEEIVSPANQPSFLQKMWSKLLEIVRRDNMPS